MRPIRSLVAVLLAVALGGCSPFKVDTDYDRAFDFAAADTYAWIEAPAAPDVVRDDLLARRIERAVDDELAARGLRRVAFDAARLHVAHHESVRQRLEVTPETYGYGYGRWGYGPAYGGAYTGTRVETYDEGTLILDFVDAATDQLVWRGTARARLRPTKTPEQRDEQVRKAVAAILERYPPGRRK